MAFAAMEIFVAEAIAPNQNAGALPMHVKLSASMASAGTAFQVPAGGGPLLIRAYPAANSFVATGASSALALQNAQTAGSPRQPTPAAQSYDFYADPGDYVAWSVA